MKTACRTDAINMSSDKCPLIVFPWCILDGSASYRSWEVQPVWYAEGKLKFLSFYSDTTSLTFIVRVSAEFSNSRWVGIHGNSMCFTSFLYFSLRTSSCQVSPPITELEAIKSRDIFALFWEQAFCRLGRSHKYLQASISESSVSDLPDRLKPQNATYGALDAGCPVPGSTEAINKKGWIHSHSHPQFSTW